MDSSKSGASQPDAASDNPPSIEELLAQGNWEERVAAARKKRDALKTQKSPTPDPKRRTPSFPEFASSSLAEADEFEFAKTPLEGPIDLIRKLAENAPAAKPRKPISPPPNVSEPPVQAKSEPGVIVPIPENAPTPVVQVEPQTQSNDKNKAALIAFACFFGIGVGGALGAGLVWSLGGFNGATTSISQQTAPIDIRPSALQIAFPLTSVQTTPGTLSGLVIPPTSETALTVAFPAQPAVLSFTEPSRAAPPPFATAERDIVETPAELAAVERPFTLGPMPVASRAVATPQLLSGIPRVEPSVLPITPTARPVPVQVQTMIPGLSALAAPTAPLPDAVTLGPFSTTTEITPVVVAIQRPTATVSTPLPTLSADAAPVQVLSVGIAPLAAPRIDGLTVDLPIATAPIETIPTPVVLKPSVGDKSPTAPAALAKPRSLRALSAIAPLSAAPQPLALSFAAPSWSVVPGFDPIQTAIPSPGSQSPGVLAASLQAPRDSIAVVSSITALEGQNNLAAIASLPNLHGTAHVPEIAASPTLTVGFRSDFPAVPALPPARPAIGWDGQPGLDQEEAANAGQLSFRVAPLDDKVGPIRKITPSLVARYDGLVPEIDAEIWRQPNLLAEIGVPEDHAKRLEFILNVPDSVADEEMIAKAESLNETGLALQKQNRVSYKITKPHIRYYNNSDARIALALAAKFDVEARDFSQSGRSNGPNRIEFWMAGETDRAPVVAKKTVRKKKAPPRRKVVRRVDPTQALRQRLARKLRQGDHL